MIGYIAAEAIPVGFITPTAITGSAEVTARIREHPRATLDGYIRYCEQRLVEQLDSDDEDDAA